MPSLKTDVHSSVIDWIMQYVSNNTKIDVVEKLLSWKNGDRKPTFSQIETIGKQLNIPLGYFFLQSPPEENFTVLQYRTINCNENETPSRDLIETINEMEYIQDWMRNYQIDTGYEELSFVGSCKHVMDKNVIAAKIRDDLNIQIDWFVSISRKTDAFKYFTRKLKETGVLIMMSGITRSNTHRPLQIEEFRAFTLIDSYVPLIFINSNDSEGGKLFSLLHETVHIWLGINNFFNDRKGTSSSSTKTEVLCNAVAAEILVPDSHFEEEWHKLIIQKNEDKIDRLTKTFKCGVASIARKAFDKKYIGAEEYNTVIEKTIDAYEKYRKRSGDKNGGDYYRNLNSRIDSRFVLALDSSVSEGRTKYADAFRLTNTSSKTYTRLVNRARGIEL